MIPRLLQLKNFLSYGPEPQTIDFANYNLICLSGKNGHGKSALLDAITWAIWGQARKTSGTSKADQGLLHLGQKHMFVILEFEVSGQNYRVRREFVQTASKPYSSLDFGIMQEDKKIVALTEKTIKETQNKIEKTIGITYESFINSAFLRQGQSNEFSKKSPKERKEILAEILQLQQFEEQKKIASLHVKNLQLEYKTSCGIKQRIESELEQLCDISQLYQSVLINISENDIARKDFLLQRQKVECSKNELLQQCKELEFIRKQYHDIVEFLQQTKSSINQISKVWNEFEKTNSGSYQKELQAQQKSLQKTLQTMQESLQKKLIFKEAYLSTREEFSKFITKAEKEIDAKIQLLQIELYKYKEQIVQIKQRQKHDQDFLKKIKTESSEIREELEQIQKLLQSNDIDMKQYQQQENYIEKIKSDYKYVCAKESLLNDKLLNIKQQNESVKNLSSTCPLCSNKLSELHQKIVQKKFEQEQLIISKTLSDLKNSSDGLKQEINNISGSIKEIKQKNEQSINFIIKHQELSKNLNKILQQEEECEKQALNVIKQEQEINSFVAELQKQLECLCKEKENIVYTVQYKKFQSILSDIEYSAKELGHNNELHKKAEEQLRDVNNKLSTCELTEKESDKQSHRKSELFSLFKTAQMYTDQRIIIEHKIKQFCDLDKKQKELCEIEKNIIIQQNIIEKKQSELFMEKGCLEQKQNTQKVLFIELEKLAKDIQILYQEIIDYQEIAKALGKDGIQALLIEQAIPEIEDETNEILARLTNNQTQIFIESLRDLKKGGSKETLDIKISDSYGLRDYELFSGGEAFRIDFALRIGISKLLARRAGTTLQTIFIDEGFGSQDEEGLQLIMDNLYKVQNDFAKIIIVSHLAEMKEHFPVQFIVEKKRLGSTVTVVEQG